MKALTYIEKGRFEMTEKAVPELLEATDAIVRVTLSSICTSDLHILHGSVPVHQFCTSSVPARELISKATNEFMTARSFADLCGISSIRHFRKMYLNPALADDAIERLYPDQPNHPKHKYRLTQAAIEWKANQSIG